MVACAQSTFKIVDRYSCVSAIGVRSSRFDRHNQAGQFACCHEKHVESAPESGTGCPDLGGSSKSVSQPKGTCLNTGQERDARASYDSTN